MEGTMTRNHEILACPICDSRFEWGTDCPDCHIELVGESVVAAYRENMRMPRPPITGWRADALRFLDFLMAANGLG